MKTLDRALEQLREERQRQEAKWGEQNHPDFHAPPLADEPRIRAYNHGLQQGGSYRTMCQDAAKYGELSWMHILLEEVGELCLAETPEDLEEELIQVAAVAVAWIEAIGRREASS